MMSRKSANLSRSWISSTTMCVMPSRPSPLVSMRSSTPLVQNMSELWGPPLHTTHMQIISAELTCVMFATSHGA